MDIWIIVKISQDPVTSHQLSSFLRGRKYSAI
jgi:hypothetical protein